MNNRLKSSPLRLPEFLRYEQEGILADWRALGQRKITASRNLSDEQQRNRVPELLESIAASAEQIYASADLAKLSRKCVMAVWWHHFPCKFCIDT